MSKYKIWSKVQSIDNMFQIYIRTTKMETIAARLTQGSPTPENNFLLRDFGHIMPITSLGVLYGLLNSQVTMLYTPQQLICLGMWNSHYNDVIMSAVASQITGVSVVYSTRVQGQTKENIKAPRHWLLWGEFTGDRWIPRTKGQWHGKCFYLMTSSCDMVDWIDSPGTMLEQNII